MTGQEKPEPSQTKPTAPEKVTQAVGVVVDDVVRTNTFRKVKRLVVGVIGGTVLLVGIAMMVLPGPAIVVIPAGLGILALEFAWARRWLRRARRLLEERAGKLKQAEPSS